MFSALGTLAFGFGDTLLPEIQATLGEPVKRGMYKAVSLCYAVISSTYLMTTIAGYWVRMRDRCRDALPHPLAAACGLTRRHS